MKKLFTKLIALMIIFIMSSGMVTFADEKPITVFLNGEQLVFDVQPALESGRTLVPMRVIFEALGAEVTWNNDTFTAIAVKDDTTIKITIDDMKLYKNDQVIELDVPARLIDGRTLVPVRAVSEGMDAKVDWDNANRKVIITTGEETQTETPKKETKEEKIYDYNYLSDADKEKLEDSKNTIRRTFEQEKLPEALYKDHDTIELIMEKDPHASQAIEKYWNDTWIAAIKDIQKNSEDKYLGIDDEGTEEGYIKLIKELGYSAEDNYKTEFIKTTVGNPVFIINFEQAKYDKEVNCKYIGIVGKNTYSPLYFTAETNPHVHSKYYFCQILYTEEEHGTYYEIEPSRKYFLDAIDDVLLNDVDFISTIDLDEDDEEGRKERDKERDKYRGIR